MEKSKPSTVEHSPLDQIRRVEAEITRQVATAKRAAEEAVQQAQARAVEVKRQACETGRREGQAQYREIVSQAEEDARSLVEHAYRQAEILCRQGDLRMDDFVRRAVEIVIGQKHETTDA